MNLSDKTRAAMLTAPENRVRAKMLEAIETQIAAAEADAAGEPPAAIAGVTRRLLWMRTKL